MPQRAPFASFGAKETASAAQAVKEFVRKNHFVKNVAGREIHHG
jgi:hypothetical protein